MTGALSHVAANLVDGDGTGPWRLDGSSSYVTIRYRPWWGLVSVRGDFTDMTGEGEILDDGTILGTMRVGAASLDTGRPERDERLRSAEFFDTENHPQIVFTLANIKLDADRDVWVEGTLAVRGVEAPLSFPARVTEISGEVVTLSGRAAVDLRSHDVAWSRLRSPSRRTTVLVSVRFLR